jgi:branched-chain amino acid transport system ATP-binding protein
MLSLRIENIDVFYGSVQILWQVSLDVREGELVSLLGSNGAGKTTTVNSISGIIPVTKGSIHFVNEDITNIPAHRRVEMGLVQIAEGRKLFPSLTVIENLEMGSFLKRPRSFRQESLDLVIGMFPILADRRKQAAGTLSGGEQQMLAIARGLMSKPRLLILDEPSLGLAPVIVEGIFKAIQEINGKGMTILLVEQNVAQALAISNMAYVLEEGRIPLVGKGKDLLTDPHIKKLYLGLADEEEYHV